MTGDTPQMLNMQYSSSYLMMPEFGGSLQNAAELRVSGIPFPDDPGGLKAFLDKQDAENEVQREIEKRIAKRDRDYEEAKMAVGTQPAIRRIVQVFIADNNENVPLDQSLIYKGDQKLTDSTDQELFYEIPIAELLKAHNEKRVKWLDKEATKRAGREIFLDAVKIRDLRMVITAVAQF